MKFFNIEISEELEAKVTLKAPTADDFKTIYAPDIKAPKIAR